MDHEARKATLLEQETKRCRALVSCDLAALDMLLAEDLVHIHANGQVDSRTDYLETVGSRLEFLEVVRGDLNVRIHGHSGIVTGRLIQKFRRRASGEVVDMNAMATQVWVESESGWRQVSFHASKLA